jgi:glycosyltransferase involved in cell wall biosynthesis
MLREVLAPVAMMKPKTILFITACVEPWGGSEELWAGAATCLAQRGHRVMAGLAESFPKIETHPNWARLKTSGVEIGGFRMPRFFKTLPEFLNQHCSGLASIAYVLRHIILTAKVRKVKADLVVISQGACFDALEWVEVPLFVCEANIPYVLICQKASEDKWPPDNLRQRNGDHFAAAEKVYFVSEHNRRLTEAMLGQKIPQAEVVRNPFTVSNLAPLPWPDAKDGVFQLACVGRLFPQDKGQDLLLSVLARRKWRERPIQVDFYGKGDREEGMRALAELLGLANVRFCGFSRDITEVWKTHHALVLPSRAEGLALAQAEAMICGRVPIMCPAGGAGEILEDNVTGFLAAASTENALDEAMERAWERRQEWPEIGRKASESIWRYFPKDPCKVFADKLEALLPISNPKSQI